MAAACSGGFSKLVLSARRPAGWSHASLRTHGRKRGISVCRASQEEDGEKVSEGLFKEQIDSVRRFTSNGLYQGIAVVSLLGLTDAAFSGDWSRIGVISRGLEHELQALVLIIAAAHAVLASVAYLILKFRGEGPVIPSLKVFAVGVLAFLEVVLAKPADQRR